MATSLYLFVALICLCVAPTLGQDKCVICSTLMRNLKSDWGQLVETHGGEAFKRLPALITSKCRELFRAEKDLSYCLQYNMNNPESLITQDMTDLFSDVEFFKLEGSCMDRTKNCKQFGCARAMSSEDPFEVMCQCIRANPSSSLFLPSFRACSFASVSCDKDFDIIVNKNKALERNLQPVREPAHALKDGIIGSSPARCPPMYVIASIHEHRLRTFGWEELKKYQYGVLDTMRYIQATIQKKQEDDSMIQKLICAARENVPESVTMLSKALAITGVTEAAEYKVGEIMFPEPAALQHGVTSWVNSISDLLPFYSAAKKIADAIKIAFDVYKTHLNKVEASFRAKCLNMEAQMPEDLPIKELFEYWHKMEAKQQVAKVVNTMLSLGGAASNLFLPGSSLVVDMIGIAFTRKYTTSRIEAEAIPEAREAVKTCIGTELHLTRCTERQIQIMRNLIAEDDHFASIFWDRIKTCKRHRGGCDAYWDSQVIRFAAYINFMEEKEISRGDRKLFPLYSLSYLKSVLHSTESSCPRAAPIYRDGLFTAPTCHLAPRPQA